MKMEVPYEDEVVLVGMDLQTRKRSQSAKNSIISPTSSDISTLTSDSSFEHTDSISIVSNGVKENPTIIEGGSDDFGELEAEKEGSFEDPKKIEHGINVGEDEIGVTFITNEGTNGFHHQNGQKDTDTGSNGSSFPKSPDTVIGFKNVESLLEESSNTTSVSQAGIYSAEQTIVNRILKSDQTEPAQEVPEFDVEAVIQKQETHDLYCPNCSSCITKRVILRRRKRKIQEISTGEEALSSDPSSTTPVSDGNLGNVTEVQETEPPATVEAVTCLSCLGIFIPTGDRFLFWKWGRKPDIVIPSGDASTEIPQNVARPVEEASLGAEVETSSVAAPIDDGKGQAFPLWILTCCQPFRSENKPEPPKKTGNAYGTAPEHESKPSPTSDTPAPPTPEPPKTPETDIPSLHKPLAPIIPDDDTSLPSETKPPTTPGTDASLPSETKPLTTPSTGNDFHLWFLTCCQPSGDENRPKHTQKPDETASEVEPKPSPTGELKIPKGESGPPLTSPREPEIPKHEVGSPLTSPSGSDKPVPPMPVPPVTPTDNTPPQHEILNIIPHPDGARDDNPLPPKPLPEIIPDDTTLPPKPQTPTTEGTDKPVVVDMPDEPPSNSHLQEIIPDDTPAPGTSLQTPLLPTQQRPRPRVSGLDIIKAIVYGGLLESITSLSVIASAAGGDATTLNIVALGLANVFGGLVVLFHNLRILKTEHVTQHYQDQLGRPGHFMVHATVAVISYLVFGLMAPLIYGFSFRKSDDKDMKLITLSAAALVCIMILSLGKAYVRRPRPEYIQTIFYYVSMGFGVSGVGYVAGHYINELLKKLGVFDSRSHVSVPVLGAGGVEAWSAY